MSIQQQIMEYLANNGVGTLGVSLFVNEIPDNDKVNDNAVVISTAGGAMDKFVDLRTKFFSFVIRNKKDNDIDSKFEQIRTLLHKNPNCISNFVVGGDVVEDIYIEDEPSYVGKDTNNRYLYEFTLKLYYERI